MSQMHLIKTKPPKSKRTPEKQLEKAAKKLDRIKKLKADVLAL
jgi:hypothetical protein